MGKKKSGRNQSTGTDATPISATAFILKLPTHCRCDGCGDKIRSGIKDLTLRCDGILSLDQSALATKGELAVVATGDPERVRRRLRKATGKSVDLVFPKPPPKPTAAAVATAAVDAKDAVAAVQAMLAGMRLQQQQQQQQPVVVHGHHHGVPVAAGGWNGALQQQQGAYGQQQAYAAYPWVLHQQQMVPPPSEPYLPSYPAVAPAYPNAASWGAYAAYPHDNGLGGGYGGGGGWFGL